MSIFASSGAAACFLTRKTSHSEYYAKFTFYGSAQARPSLSSRTLPPCRGQGLRGGRPGWDARSDLFKFRRRALDAMRAVMADKRRGPKRPANRLPEDREQRVRAACERWTTFSAAEIRSGLGDGAPLCPHDSTHQVVPHSAAAFEATASRVQAAKVYP